MIEASHMVSYVWGQFVKCCRAWGRLGGYRGLTYDGLCVECNVSYSYVLIGTYSVKINKNCMWSNSVTT